MNVKVIGYNKSIVFRYASTGALVLPAPIGYMQNGGTMNEKIKEYLETKYETPLRVLSVKELGLESQEQKEGLGEIKGFGYGKPYFVKFQTGGAGEIKEVVISSMRGDGFGHDHFADRAQILIWQHHAFNTLPKHVKSIDVGYFTRDGRMESASDAEEYFIVCDKVEGAEYVKDLDKLR
ncbi:MAG: hypothetical protein U9N01_04735, partial [Euryarchaeota archaeon]|nr:hypothetical protein [Euryarchaeota archaeon]